MSVSVGVRVRVRVGIRVRRGHACWCSCAIATVPNTSEHLHLLEILTPPHHPLYTDTTSPPVPSRFGEKISKMMKVLKKEPDRLREFEAELPDR